MLRIDGARICHDNDEQQDIAERCQSDKQASSRICICICFCLVNTHIWHVFNDNDNDSRSSNSRRTVVHSGVTNGRGPRIRAAGGSYATTGAEAG